MKGRWMLAVALVGSSVLAASPVLADGPLQLKFDDPAWEIDSPAFRVAPLDGQPGLRLRGGRAARRDVSFQDGTLEFDLALTRRRSFVGVQLRCQADGDSEYVYFRPHKSTLPDAVQYTPELGGNTNWQLYHGEGGTAAVEFPVWQWVHVRVVLAGRQMAVFFDDGAEPALVARLALEPKPGFVRLLAGAPGLEENEPDFAAFANVVVRPGSIPYAFPAPRAVETPPGLVTAWEVTPPFVASPEAITALPDDLATRPWRAVATEENGLLLLSRYLERPEDAPWWGTYARLVLDTPEARLVPVELGFSDNVTVFLAGRPIFSAQASYSFDAPRREGLIGLDQSTVYLPLAAGRNELVVAVSERFGGWGLMARVVDGEGVGVQPSPHD